MEFETTVSDHSTIEAPKASKTNQGTLRHHPRKDNLKQSRSSLRSQNKYKEKKKKERKRRRVILENIATFYKHDRGVQIYAN